MSNSTEIPAGLFIPSQIRLNPKSFVQTLDSLIDLGEEEVKPYTYHDSLLIYCKEDNNYYIWKERTLEEEFGLLENDFVYDDNTVTDDFNYSNKSYNFFIFNTNNLKTIKIDGESFLLKKGYQNNDINNIELGDLAIDGYMIQDNAILKTDLKCVDVDVDLTAMENGGWSRVGNTYQVGNI